MSVNKVILVGNVGKDPETRYLDENTAITKFPLATSETYKNRQGERVSNTEWHNIVLWRGLAQVAEKYVKKGTQIYIEGRIKTRSYDDANGVKKYITEIVGDQMQMLGRRADGDGMQSAAGGGGQSAAGGAQTPQGGQSATGGGHGQSATGGGGTEPATGGAQTPQGGQSAAGGGHGQSATGGAQTPQGGQSATGGGGTEPAAGEEGNEPATGGGEQTSSQSQSDDNGSAPSSDPFDGGDNGPDDLPF